MYVPNKGQSIKCFNNWFKGQAMQAALAIKTQATVHV